MLEQAASGVERSAHRAATAVLRRLRERVRLAVGHHGISGSSYRRDIEGWFHGTTNFLVAGPPGVRVEQMLALVEAGVVHLVGPEMVVGIDRDVAAFTAASPAVNAAPVAAGTDRGPAAGRGRAPYGRSAALLHARVGHLPRSHDLQYWRARLPGG